MKNLTQAQKKLILQRDSLLDQRIKRTLKKVQKEYLTLSYWARRQKTALLNEIKEDDDKPLSNYFTYNKYYSLLLGLESKCKKLAKIEQILIEEELVELYIIFYDDFVDREQAEQAIYADWVGDGKNWLQRLYEHEGKLYGRIDQLLLTAITAHWSEEQTINELKKYFDQAFNEDKALVDTESSHTMNKALSDYFEKKGIQNFVYVCVRDERTCTTCLAKDGRVFRVGDTVNTPPTHCNCRCAVLPITNNNYLI